MSQTYDRDGNEIDRRTSAHLARIRWVEPLPKTATDAVAGIATVGVLLGRMFEIRFRRPAGGWFATAYISSEIGAQRVEFFGYLSFANTKRGIVDHIRTHIARQRGDAQPWSNQ